MSVTVGVVTVTHDSDAVLRPFLESVRREQDTSVLVDHVQVVVCDNASADPSGGREVSVALGATFLDTRRNAGYGGGIRRAVAALDGPVDFVLVSNPDVVLGPGALDALVRCALRRPRAGALGPRIVDADGTVYPSARALPSLSTGIGHALLARSWPENPWSRTYKESARTDVERTAGWLSGACLLVRSEAWREVGGFDESFFMYFEDVDLGERLARAGWENVFVPTANVVHTGAHSTSKSSAVMERVHHESAYTYLARRYSSVWATPVRLALRLGLRARSWWTTR